MKAKVKASGEIIDAVMCLDEPELFLYKGTYYQKSDLEFLPDTPEEVTIEGYAVRWHNGEITVFQKEPIRIIGDDEHYDGWESKDGCRLFLPNDALPFVTYKNSPQRVKITITPME